MLFASFIFYLFCCMLHAFDWEFDCYIMNINVQTREPEKKLKQKWVSQLYNAYEK